MTNKTNEQVRAERDEKIEDFRRTWGSDPDVELFIQDNEDQFGYEWPDQYPTVLEMSDDFLLYVDNKY